MKKLLYGLSLGLLSAFALYTAGDILYRRVFKPKTAIKAAANPGKQISDLEKTVNKISEPEPKIEHAEKLPIYKGYESEILQKYDDMIISICNDFENKTQIKGIKAPPKDLMKKIILIETAYKGQPVDEFFTDPSQTKKDNAYNFAVNGADEGFYPENGFEFLKDKGMGDVEKTLWAEAIYLAHIASKYSEKNILLSEEQKQYTIQSGDTIFDIAKEFSRNGFSTTQEAILESNNIKNPELIQIGQKLMILNAKKSRVIDNIDFSEQKALALRYNGNGDLKYGSKFDELEPVK